MTVFLVYRAVLMAPTSVQCLVIAFTTLLALTIKFAGAANLGVCYTRAGDNLPPPADAVKLYQIHKIGRMRIYEPDHDILEALKGTTIQLTVGVPNVEIGAIARDESVASDWVRDHIEPYRGHVRFRYVVVGHNDVVNARDAKVVLQAMKNLHAIINDRHRMHIKITTEVTVDVVERADAPSGSTFQNSSSSGTFMEPIVQFLVSNDAPLFVSFQPYFVQGPWANFPRDGANSEEMKKYFSTDTPVDLLLIIVDLFYAALEKVGGRQTKVVVGETGWPSADGDRASVDEAKKYVWALAGHALSKKGTPMRPDRQMETYVYELFNENKRRAGVYRNFGMFYPNKEPTYGVPPLQ